MWRYFLKNHAVRGQADRPENRTNQPLVSGHGPRVIMSSRPAMAVKKAHAQAMTHPSIRRIPERLIIYRMGRLAGLDSAAICQDWVFALVIFRGHVRLNIDTRNNTGMFRIRTEGYRLKINAARLTFRKSFSENVCEGSSYFYA